MIKIIENDISSIYNAKNQQITNKRFICDISPYFKSQVHDKYERKYKCVVIFIDPACILFHIFSCKFIWRSK